MYQIRRFCWLCILCFWLSAEQQHDHGTPEKLGIVSFPISCAPAVQSEFDRGVALLHSFAYKSAEDTFRGVAERDNACAMAHWGVAMAQFHQLWDPPVNAESLALIQGQVEQARAIRTPSLRERKFIEALALIFDVRDTAPYQARVASYQRAVCEIAAGEQKDVEAQIFCALALLASESPQDKSHRNQKRAAELLEPLFRKFPDHPGIPHYLIHAYDNAELATRGLAAARIYSTIAPSAPHALHMPSHIFTRLGLWEESIASNRAAKKAAQKQKDTGEELHAMDYLMYAYLQLDRDREAKELLNELSEMKKIDHGDFKVAYAATAMPIRFAVERSRWIDAANLPFPEEAPPHVQALAAWARGIGLARTGHGNEAGFEAEKLTAIEKQLNQAGSAYWASQVSILRREVQAWTRQAANQKSEAVNLMRAAADEEDAIEKLPVTPGPIVPAREQLGYLLREQNRTSEALKEFRASLLLAPGRVGAVRGAAAISEATER